MESAINLYNSLIFNLNSQMTITEYFSNQVLSLIAIFYSVLVFVAIFIYIAKSFGNGDYKSNLVKNLGVVLFASLALFVTFYMSGYKYSQTQDGKIEQSYAVVDYTSLTLFFGSRMADYMLYKALFGDKIESNNVYDGNFLLGNKGVKVDEKIDGYVFNQHTSDLLATTKDVLGLTYNVNKLIAKEGILEHYEENVDIDSVKDTVKDLETALAYIDNQDYTFNIIKQLDNDIKDKSITLTLNHKTLTNKFNLVKKESDKKITFLSEYENGDAKLAEVLDLFNNYNNIKDNIKYYLLVIKKEYDDLAHKIKVVKNIRKLVHTQSNNNFNIDKELDNIEKVKTRTLKSKDELDKLQKDIFDNLDIHYNSKLTKDNLIRFNEYLRNVYYRLRIQKEILANNVIHVANKPEITDYKIVFAENAYLKPLDACVEKKINTIENVYNLNYDNALSNCSLPFFKFKKYIADYKKMIKEANEKYSQQYNTENISQINKETGFTRINLEELLNRSIPMDIDYSNYEFHWTDLGLVFFGIKTAMINSTLLNASINANMEENDNLNRVMNGVLKNDSDLIEDFNSKEKLKEIGDNLALLVGINTTFNTFKKLLSFNINKIATVLTSVASGFAAYFVVIYIFMVLSVIIYSVIPAIFWFIAVMNWFFKSTMLIITFPLSIILLLFDSRTQFYRNLYSLLAQALVPMGLVITFFIIAQMSIIVDSSARKMIPFFDSNLVVKSLEQDIRDSAYSATHITEDDLLNSKIALNKQVDKFQETVKKNNPHWYSPLLFWNNIETYAQGAKLGGQNIYYNGQIVLKEMQEITVVKEFQNRSQEEIANAFKLIVTFTIDSLYTVFLIFINIFLFRYLYKVDDYINETLGVSIRNDGLNTNELLTRYGMQKLS